MVRINTLSGPRPPVKSITTTLPDVEFVIMPVFTKDKVTHYGYLLDASGSMSPQQDVVIDGFNESIDNLARNVDENEDKFVTVVAFGERKDSAPEVKSIVQKAEYAYRLTRSNYQPAGVTPLLDGIGTIIKALRNVDIPEKDVNFVVTIFTDGYENASEHFDPTQIKGLVDELEGSGRWAFNFIGANIDPKWFENLGIHRGFTYTPDPIGTQVAWDAHNVAQNFVFNARSREQSVSSVNYSGGSSSSLGPQASVSSVMDALNISVDPDVTPVMPTNVGPSNVGPSNLKVTKLDEKDADKV